MQSLRGKRNRSASATAQTAAGPLLMWFSDRKRRQERPALSRITKTATAPVVDRLRKVSNPDEFDLAIHELFEYDTDAARGYMLLRHSADVTELESPDNEIGISEEVADYLGYEGLRILESGIPWLNEYVRLGLGINDSATKQHKMGDEEPTPRDAAGVLGDIINLAAPTALLRLVATAIRGNLAGMLIVGCLETKERLPDWLGALAAERYLEGIKASVIYLGSIGEVKPTPSLVAPGELLNLEALLNEDAEARVGLQLLMMEHRQSGRTVSYPFGGPIDDE